MSCRLHGLNKPLRGSRASERRSLAKALAKNTLTPTGAIPDQRVCTRIVATSKTFKEVGRLGVGACATLLLLITSPKLQATCLSCTTLLSSGLRLKGPPGVTTSQVSCRSKLYTCSNCCVTNLVCAAKDDIHNSIG